MWYVSLRPIANDWQALQEQFRQQYPKIGNTREQLFYVWRSFHYDENAEMIDAYVNCIRQVKMLLGYEEQQILEVFHKTIPNRLYWILYPIDNLRLAFETVKRFLTKEKIDRQMSGKSTTAPFMKVNDGHKSSFKDSSKKAVPFDALETIKRNSDSKIVISKMNMKMDKCDTQYVPQVY